jgi:prepilin-type processing-associated H-X9-DG protein
MYMNDYNGYYYPGYYPNNTPNMCVYYLMPFCGAAEWSSSSFWWKHLPAVYCCPCHEAASKNFNNGSGEGSCGSYVMNVFVSNFRHPIDDYANTAAQYFMLDFYTVGHTAPTELLREYQRHNGEGNYLFMDGHVEGQSDLGPLPLANDPTYSSFPDYKIGWKAILISH